MFFYLVFTVQVYDFDNHASDQEDLVALPPASDASQARKGRMTNQLNFLLKKMLPSVWKHQYAWPFHKPVDATKMKLKVFGWQFEGFGVFYFGSIYSIVYLRCIVGDSAVIEVFVFLSLLCCVWQSAC